MSENETSYTVTDITGEVLSDLDMAAMGEPGESNIACIPSPRRPRDVARIWRAIRWVSRSGPVLIVHRDEWLEWDDDEVLWKIVPRHAIRDELWEWLAAQYWWKPATRRDPAGPVPWCPNTGTVNNVMDAFEALIRLDDDWKENSWLPWASDDDAKLTDDCLVMPTTSGLMVVPRCQPCQPRASLVPASKTVKCQLEGSGANLANLLPITSTWYGRRVIYINSRGEDTKLAGMAGTNGHSSDQHVSMAVPTSFMKAGTKSDGWQKFLGQLWPHDKNSILLLQEWFGYNLSGEMKAQKAMLIKGPKRSGKGTICAVLKMLAGERTCVSTSLTSLTERFGLQNFIGKSVAIISDAEFRSGGKDVAVAVERLKAITGCDDVEVDRKNKTAWNGKLNVRFTICANKVPRLTDDSAALASRFLTLILEQSWLGNENLNLIDELSEELEGILFWSLEGLHRLQHNGWRFTQADDGGIAEELENLGAPVKAFVEECCFRNASTEILLDTLYDRYQSWCWAGGSHPPVRDVFSKELTAAYPELKRDRRQEGGNRQTYIRGIRISK